MESGTWLRYWRNALADANRKHIELSKQPFLTEASLSAQQLQAFYEQHRTTSPKPGIEGEPETLEVILAPFCLRPAIDVNRRTTYPSRSRQIHPYWIPARLTAGGQLLPPTGKELLIPWLVRDVLEPTTQSFPVLSTVTRVDNGLIHWNWKTTESWEVYWADAQAFYAKATTTPGWPVDRTMMGDWSVERILTITLLPPQGMTAGIIGLYRYLEKQPRLPQLLMTLLQGRPAGPALDPASCSLLYVKGHYGQMSNGYPLSPSQRTTLQALLITAPGDVFPVNGPPGTGKTTLLQSVVANLVVEKALLGKEAPCILASSTNNQAITNILDSFGQGAREPVGTRRELAGRVPYQ
jgi:hypothetical protein